MANKKINQLVAKTTIQSTDLFPLGDPTTGQLFKKTVAELQAAIGGAVISVNGLTGVVVLDTDDVQELASPTNRYFTEARARAAISLTTTGSSGASTYSSSTGVLNVPTYTLAGLGGISASFLSGGTGITYNSGTGVISYSGTVYTDASVRGLVSAGTGLSYNSSTGVFSYSGTVYTDSSIRALISLTTTGSSGAATYNNTTGVINVPNYTLAGLGGISLTSLSGSAPITYNSSTGAIGITQATTSTNGYLSATDWNTFNGKQSALTLGNVTESVSNVLMFPDGGTNKTIGNLSIQVVQAGSTSSGYLSTTDWNTFNNKQNAITLTTTGTSGAATFSGGTLNIPQYQSALTNPVTGTGTSGYVTFWNGTSTISGDSAHFWDNTNKRLGIGTSSPNHPLSVKSDSSANGINIIAESGGYGQLSFSNAGNTVIGNAITQVPNSTSYDMYLSTYNGTSRTTKMVITGAGNVGIGTSSPSTNLHILKSTSGEVLRIESTATNTGTVSPYLQFVSANQVGGTGFSTGYIGTMWTAEGNGFSMIFATKAVDGGQVERFRITHDGLFGVGSSVATRSFQITRNRTAFINAEGVTVAIGSSNAPLEFYSNNVNAINVTSSGNVLLNTTTDNGEKLYVSGSIRATGSITANSDARLKKNIERIENALEKVEQISGYTYNTIYDEDRHAGVIAQEIDKVLPEIVNKGNDGLMGVEYGNISALLIEAIKEQKGIIDSLQARLSALEK